MPPPDDRGGLAFGEPPSADLQARCERGQQQLMRTEYLEAEATLAAAEADAWASRDFDTLSRLYMPLQEARRQIRQRCAEGEICLQVIANDAAEEMDPHGIVEEFPHGQLLIAGWATIEPALQVRKLQRRWKLYLETLLGAVFPIAGGGHVLAVVPLADVAMPDAQPRAVDELIRRLPAHTIVLTPDDVLDKSANDSRVSIMNLWERLHAPFLAAADMQVDPIQKIEAYRKTQRVDYGCELAHQKASDVARELARQQRHSRRQPS